MANLRTRWWTVASKCYMWKNCKETPSHLWLNCEVDRDICSMANSTLGIDWVLPQTLDLFVQL